MIDDDFNFNEIIQNVGFHVSLGEVRYSVTTDNNVQHALKEILEKTKQSILDIDGAWQDHDISEDYGDPRKIYAPRATEYLHILSGIFEAGAFDLMEDFVAHVREVDYYFATFTDNQGRSAIGIKKSNYMKGLLSARGRLIKWANETLEVLDSDVLRLDPTFDAIICNTNIFILKPRAIEYIADIVRQVAGTAIVKAEQIENAVDFLDMTMIKEGIENQPRKARLVSSIAAREDLSQMQRDKVEEMAEQQNITLSEVNGRLQCNDSRDEIAFLEILDARRYNLDMTGVPISYRATARKKIS